MNQFTDKNVLVTGSTRGIGRAIALEFAKKGARIILHGSKKTDHAMRTYQAVYKHSPKSHIYFSRIDNYQSVSGFAKKISKDFRLVNIIVNNAGIVQDKSFMKMTYLEWDKVVKTNLYGVFNITKNILPLVPKGGRIINISSIVAVKGAFGQTNYAAAKAGIIGFTKSLAIELARSQITVNAICPGYTNTDMIKNIPEQILNSQILPKIILGRLAQPDEIASLVIYLSSPQASYITGQVINIDGGLS